MNNYIHNHPYRLKDFIQFNPKEKLPKGAIARKITMEQLSPNNRYVESNIFEEYKGGSKFRNGDTIMARITPCLENGKTAYITSLNENELAFGSTEFIVFRKIEGKSNSKYIYYLLKTPQIRDIAIKSMVGSSGRQRVQQNVLENYEVLLPTLDKQIEIASILSSLDDKIELNRRINENLEQQAQALFKSWFVDFEPFKDGKFVDSELGMIPEGWQVGQISDFGKIICGKTPSKASKDFFGGNIPFIKIPDMHNQLFISHSEDSLSYKGSSSQQNKLLPPYSLLVSCIATVGLVGINTKPSHTNQQINSIVPYKSSYLFYLYLSIILMKKKLENMGRGGTATLNVNTTSFGKISLIIPKQSILDNFSSIVSPLFKNIENLSEQIFKLSQLRNTLLPRLMSGELEIKDNSYD